jgi:uncharacterized membrane protein YhaH (DUF805 family)
MDIIKKALTYLKFHSWTYTVILTFALYLVSGKIPTSANYSFNWVQALIATLGILLGVLSVTKAALWLFLRRFHDYLYGHRCKPDPSKPEGEQAPPKKYFNQSFYDFRGLEKDGYRLRHTKLIIALFIFCLFLVIAVVIFLKVVSVAAVGEIYVSN